MANMKTRWCCLAALIVCCHLATAQPPDGDGLEDFYHPDQVQTIHLRVAESEVQQMHSALPKRIYVPASFRWRDVSIDNVAIRFKGNSSSHPNQPHKRSFLVRFDEYEDDQRFFGLRRVSFDNGVQFGSLFSEPIITEILREQGITTHRCNYAKLYLNDEYQGVYVNVERIDESFIEQHLPDVEGALFKVDEGGPGCNLQFLGDHTSAYKKTFEAKNDAADRRDLARLVDFIKLINQSPQSEFAEKLQSKFELDEFLRVTAVMLFSGAFDQLTGWGPHNYYLYHDPGRDRWRYLPWDLDVGFCKTAFGKVRVLADWNAAWPVAPSGRPNPLLERIVDDPVLLERYRRAARTILQQSFEPDRLCAIVDAKYALIQQDLQTDPFPHRRATVPDDRDYDDIVGSIKDFVRLRYALALEQLENPGSRPKIKHGPPGGPPPQLAQNIRHVEQRARQMQRNGHDVTPIAMLMRTLPPLIQQQKWAEAEAVVQQALKLVGERPNGPERESPRN
jgi:hypothetical protein